MAAGRPENTTCTDDESRRCHTAREVSAPAGHPARSRWSARSTPPAPPKPRGVSAQQAMKLEVQRALRRSQCPGKSGAGEQRRRISTPRPRRAAQGARAVHYENLRSARAEEGILRLLLCWTDALFSAASRPFRRRSSPLPCCAGPISACGRSARQRAAAAVIAALARAALPGRKLSHLTICLPAA